MSGRRRQQWREQRAQSRSVSHIRRQMATFHAELMDANTGRFSKRSHCIGLPPTNALLRSIEQFAYKMRPTGLKDLNFSLVYWTKNLLWVDLWLTVSWQLVRSSYHNLVLVWIPVKTIYWVNFVHYSSCIPVVCCWTFEEIRSFKSLN